VLLYQSFGWEPPKFFHLGLLRNPDANKTKISKRKNPVSLRWFRAAGYLPESLLNFLGNMGYSRHHSGMTEEETKNVETFSLQTMISDFDEKRISPTGPSFDFVKLDDMHFHYMTRLTEDQFFDALCARQKYLQSYFKGFNSLFVERFLRAEKEITYWTSFLFKNSLQYSREVFDKAGFENPKSAAEALKKFRKALSDAIETLHTVEDIKIFVKNCVDTLGITSKQLHMLLRIAITGSHESLPLYDSMVLLGLYRSLIRCDEAAQFLNSLR
jgi:glutamyl-tRNA synthetase